MHPLYIPAVGLKKEAVLEEKPFGFLIAYMALSKTVGGLPEVGCECVRGCLCAVVFLF